MPSYGRLTINDGILPDARSSSMASFSLNITCFQNVYNGSGLVSFSKSFERVASSRNPLDKAKLFLSRFIGCDEAARVRRRILAISKTKVSISEEEFRFRLP